MSQDPVVIVGSARTPIGGFQGDFASLQAPDLAGVAIKAAVDRAGVAATEIEELLLGCVLVAGLGQAPAKQAAIAAGLPLSTGCATISKVCGSGLKATMVAHDMICAGSAEIMIAGGMESMTNSPYLLDRARSGYRLGHGKVTDHMFLDGLEDAYFDKGRLMGTFAEDCAQSYGFTRQQQDNFALESLSRARKAIETGLFAAEVASVAIRGRKGETLIKHDEQPLKATPEKIPTLKPAFRPDGTVTAANSSSISDGAAALVMTRRSLAERRGLKVVAEIKGHVTHAQQPALFTTAPVGAMRKLLAKVGWIPRDVGLWEINEAFAVVTMAAMRDLDLPHDQVNVHGGACALGHPIGASGARLLVTLLAAMERYDVKRGIASLCIGGGEAVAVAVERP
ncbi:Acetyl-CoA acetyltransferase [uncultured Gammaproteobacteria bacterium]